MRPCLPCSWQRRCSHEAGRNGQRRGVAGNDLCGLVFDGLFGKAKRKTDLMWDFGRNQFFKKPGNANDRSPHLAIRSGNWKLLINSDGSDAQLYDIVKDKFEKNDVAQSHPQVVAKLSKKVCKWFAENKDKGKE